MMVEYPIVLYEKKHYKNPVEAEQEALRNKAGVTVKSSAINWKGNKGK